MKKRMKEEDYTINYIQLMILKMMEMDDYMMIADHNQKIMKAKNYNS